MTVTRAESSAADTPAPTVRAAANSAESDHDPLASRTPIMIAGTGGHDGGGYRDSGASGPAAAGAQLQVKFKLAAKF